MSAAPERSKGGRPLSMTDEVTEKLLVLLKLGNYVDTSCRSVGISRETFYSWLRRGKEETEGPFADFRRRAYQAIAEAEVRMLANIANAAATDWHADAWRLERRFPKRWGKRDELGVRLGTGPGGAAPVKQIVIAFEEPSCANAAAPPASSTSGAPSASSSTGPKPGPTST